MAGVVAAGMALVVLMGALVLVALAHGSVGSAMGGLSTTTGYSASAQAEADIPSGYLSLYQRAAQRYGLDWTVLAGIGKVECDHGRSPAPACTQEGAVNSAGAGGPAQFLASTWRAHGVDGDGDGVADRWDPADAIFGMANYLRASGAPGDYQRAIFAYNHAQWYVDEVEHWAQAYRGPRLSSSAASGASAPVQLVGGTHALLSPANGHVALIPAGAPPAVQQMLIAGNELQDLPYGPAGHPNPVGAPNQDCSSSVNYLLLRAGVRSLGELLRENPLAQSYPSWGLPGTGRWVSIYATTRPTDHVFIVVAGLRLDTSHNGTDTGPNRDQDGPRWRLLDHIPTWARWSVRHPPGL